MTLPRSLYQPRRSPFEVFVVGGIALIFLTIAIAVACGLYASVSGIDGEHAQTEAARWMHRQGVEGRPECTSTDTDGDGFVDCTIVQRRADGSTELLPLECAGKLTFARGCRAVKPVARQR